MFAAGDKMLAYALEGSRMDQKNSGKKVDARQEIEFIGHVRGVKQVWRMRLIGWSISE